jgi:Zn-dependent protease
LQNGNVVETLFNLMKFFVPFLFALCFHEFAHGLVARMRGDRTAEIMGRLTLNPMAHADPFGTFLFPIIGFLFHVPLFGWAKPVPVDERNLKSPKSDMFWVAAAGPLSNIFLAIVAAFGLAIFYRANLEAIIERQEGALQAADVLQNFVLLNAYLAFFNLIPLHPLDGGKVLARFLPDNVNRKLEDMQTYTSFLLLFLFVSGAAVLIAWPAQWFSGHLVQFTISTMGGT